LAESVATLEAVHAELKSKVVDAAWNTDLAATRQALATHTGLLKALSGDYRRAKALVRSLLVDANTPSTEIVRLLDILMKGQAAAARVRDGDAFGRSAFGADWRREKSSSAPLLALVEWMRTLRGL
ncbi:MAG: hypothetical protein E5V99_32395, partial [Mesorhizobium sp.]